MPVPIFRIAYLPLKIIVECIENVEIVSISLCSKRADRAVKQCGKRNTSYFNLSGSDIWGLNELQQLELFLMESERTDKQVLKQKEVALTIVVSEGIVLKVPFMHWISLKIEIIRTMDKYRAARKYLQFNDTCVPAVKSGINKVCTFWNQFVEGLMIFVNYFYANFNCTIDIECVEEVNDLRDFTKIARYIIQAGVKVRNVEVNSWQTIPDADYKYILENLKVTERFRSILEVSKNFRFDGRIQAPCIQISGGSWFTFRHLSCDEYEKVKFLETEFTQKQVNWLLKQVRLGKITKLKKLELKLNVDSENVTFRKFERIVARYENPHRKDRWFVCRTIANNRHVTAKIWIFHGTKNFTLDVNYGEPVKDGEERNEVVSEDDEYEDREVEKIESDN